jgi:hypothetical protein
LLHLHLPCGKPEKKSPGKSPEAFLSKYTDVALEMLRRSFDSNVDEWAEKSDDKKKTLFNKEWPYA